MESPAKKKKHNRHFQETWLKDPEFKDWLTKENNINNNVIMKCLICCETKMKSIFTSGCMDFQRSALVRHITSDAHRRALQIKSSRNSLVKSFKFAEEKASDSLTLQLKTVYFIVKNNIPLHAYTPLLELQKSNGCEGLQQGHYVSHDAVSEMVQSLACSLTDDIKREIEGSKFIGILTDESCDIAIFKKLIIYVQTVVNGRIKVSFAANLDVVDGKAETIHNAIKGLMDSWNIPVGKVMGLATDGAAVMTGVRSGVGVRMLGDNFRLVHIHCVAHKLALAVSQAAASVNAVKAYEGTVENVYVFFRNSAVRYNRLRSVYALLEDDDLITLKRPHPVRWLSLHQAVAAIHDSWAALVMTLGEEAVNNDQARGYLRLVDKFGFISLTCLLMDILPLFTKLSKIFQRACLDFSAVRTGLQTTRNTLITYGENTGEMLTYTALRDQVAETGSYQGQPLAISDADETNFIRTKDALIGSLLEKLEQRFPSETMHVMKSFDAIFSPKLYPEEHGATSAYGKEDLKQLLDHYQPAEPGEMNVDILNRDRCLRDFLQFKHHTRLHSHMGFADYIQHVITTLNEEYPDYVVLGQLALCVPLNSASCERGFSSQNLTKNKARNRLCDDTLQDLMKISINGPHFAQFDYTDAARNFRALKARRK